MPNYNGLTYNLYFKRGAFTASTCKSLSIAYYIPYVPQFSDGKNRCEVVFCGNEKKN